MGNFEIYEDAILTFGEESQIDMAIEEMSDLIKALLKYRRAIKFDGANVGVFDNVAEEMADVAIMLEQLYLIFNNRECVNSKIEAKTIRLKERINAYIKKKAERQEREKQENSNRSEFCF